MPKISRDWVPWLLTVVGVFALLITIVSKEYDQVNSLDRNYQVILDTLKDVQGHSEVAGSRFYARDEDSRTLRRIEQKLDTIMNSKGIK